MTSIIHWNNIGTLNQYHLVIITLNKCCINIRCLQGALYSCPLLLLIENCIYYNKCQKKVVMRCKYVTEKNLLKRTKEKTRKELLWPLADICGFIQGSKCNTAQLHRATKTWSRASEYLMLCARQGKCF